MKISKLLFTLLLTALSLVGFSQEYEIKKNTVYLGQQELYTFKFSMITSETTIYDKDKTELISIIHDNGGTTQINTDDYLKFVFLSLNKHAVSNTFMAFTPKKMVQRLLEFGVLTPEGTIDEGKVDMFINKYHKNVSEMIIR